jgi:predicted dehydrogenase
MKEYPLAPQTVVASNATDENCPISVRKTTLRFGVIGFGYWGPQLVRNLDRLAQGQVTCIADLSLERRQAAQLLYPTANVTADIEEVLQSDVDAVAVATPIRTHYQLARMALQQGKHVLVEKPLTASTTEARALMVLAEQQKRVLMVGHTFIYSPAVEELRRLVQSGALGKIFYINATRANLGLLQNDINVIWDLAPHDLSILDYILGATPLQVSAHGGAYVRPDVHDVAHISLRYPEGVLAYIHVSWLSPSKIRHFTIVGNQQMAVYDDVQTTEKIRIYNRGVDVPERTSTFGEFQLSYRYGDIVSPYIQGAEPLAIECQHFAEAILGGKPVQSGAQEGLRIVNILEATDASLAAGGAFIDVVQSEEQSLL